VPADVIGRFVLVLRMLNRPIGYNCSANDASAQKRLTSCSGLSQSRTRTCCWIPSMDLPAKRAAPQAPIRPTARRVAKCFNGCAAPAELSRWRRLVFVGPVDCRSSTLTKTARLSSTKPHTRAHNRLQVTEPVEKFMAPWRVIAFVGQRAYDATRSSSTPFRYWMPQTSAN
jgi:hypothetical protein